MRSGPERVRAPRAEGKALVNMRTCCVEDPGDPEVARAQGDELTASSAELEAASAGVLAPMFGVLGQARA